MRRSLAALLLLAVACGSERPEAGPTPTARPSATAAAPSVPIDGIGERTETFVDERRGGRELRTTIWYPTSNDEPTPGPHPVVVFSHGLGGLPGAYEPLFDDWVRAGLVIVGPTYPQTNAGVSTRPGDLLNQPADVSFVLDEIAELSSDDGDRLGGLLDTERVAAVGHSLGGMTTVGLLRGCCDEPRLDAAVVYAGSDLGFARHELVDDPPPVLFIHGDEDGTVPIDGARRVYEDLDGPRAFITLVGGSHSPPFFSPADPYAELVSKSTLAFLRWRLFDDGSALDAFRDEARAEDLTEVEDELSR